MLHDVAGERRLRGKGRGLRRQASRGREIEWEGGRGRGGGRGMQVEREGGREKAGEERGGREGWRGESGDRSRSHGITYTPICHSLECEPGAYSLHRHAACARMPATPQERARERVRARQAGKTQRGGRRPSGTDGEAVWESETLCIVFQSVCGATRGLRQCRTSSSLCSPSKCSCGRSGTESGMA